MGLAGNLVCIAVLLVRIFTAYISGRVHRVQASVELIGFAVLIYLLVEPSFVFLQLTEIMSAAQKAVLSGGLFAVAFLINGLIRDIFWNGILSHHGTRKVPLLITEGVALTIYSVVILCIMHFVFDQPVTGLLATSGVAALVVGFAAQSTLKEVFSGVALNATQALHIGDYVEIDGTYGCVHEIGWRSISIKNPHTDSLYIFPNSGVAERTILNFSEPTERFKYFVHFTAEISAPPDLVISAIQDELAYSRFVYRDPAPDFNLLGYSKEGIDFRVRYFFDGDDSWWDAQNEMIMAIWNAMRKKSLRIAINRHLLGSGDEWVDLNSSVEKRYDSAQLEKVLAASQYFGSSESTTLEDVVRTSKVVTLNPPAFLYRPGDPSDGMYLVLEGTVAIYQIDELNEFETKVETCGAGQLFGCTSYLNGTERRYLAQAERYASVLHLTDICMQKLKKQPGVTETLQHLVTERSRARKETCTDALRAIAIASHSKRKRLLAKELRQGFSSVFDKPILTHFLGALSSKIRNEELVNAVAAAAAIVASCRGSIDQVEIDHLLNTLETADLLKHFNKDAAVELFKRHVDIALSDQNSEGLTQAITQVAGIKGGADIVMVCAFGMTGLHGLATAEERTAFSRIASLLDSPLNDSRFHFHD